MMGWIKRHWLKIVLVCITLLIAMLLLLNGMFRPSYFRWFVWSHAYKAELLKQPASSSQGNLQHISWDGWGFAGLETEVYLVFDPNASLAKANLRDASGHFKGIPCDVPRVHRLEDQWYIVQFYTNQAWNDCGN